jgi:hypothetical protein
VAFPGAEAEASELQELLSDHLGHDEVQVRPYGQHLVVEALRDDGPEPVARLTRLDHGRYGLSFRQHTGRWEQVPLAGTLEEVAKGAAQMLAPYFDPSIY